MAAHKITDPASPEFLKLPPAQQACVLYFDIGWDERSIADELDTNVKTVSRWLDSEILECSKDHVRLNVRSGAISRTYSIEKCEREFGEVCNLHRRGLTPKEIVERTGVPQATVYRVIASRFGTARVRAQSASNSTKREAA